jgi:hypothetical protein
VPKRWRWHLSRVQGRFGRRSRRRLMLAMNRCDLLWKERTEILPSLDAHARIGPRSYGAQARELTTVSVVERSLTTRRMQRMLLDSLPPVLQLSTASLALSRSDFLPDKHSTIVRARSQYGAKARVSPGELPDGCSVASVRAAGCSTYPLRITGSPLASPLTTLKIRMVLSDEQVARRLP